MKCPFYFDILFNLIYITLFHGCITNTIMLKCKILTSMTSLLIVMDNVMYTNCLAYVKTCTCPSHRHPFNKCLIQASNQYVFVCTHTCVYVCVRTKRLNVSYRSKKVISAGNWSSDGGCDPKRSDSLYSIYNFHHLDTVTLN